MLPHGKNTARIAMKVLTKPPPPPVMRAHLNESVDTGAILGIVSRCLNELRSDREELAMRLQYSVTVIIIADAINRRRDWADVTWWKSRNSYGWKGDVPTSSWRQLSQLFGVQARQGGSKRYGAREDSVSCVIQRWPFIPKNNEKTLRRSLPRHDVKAFVD